MSISVSSLGHQSKSRPQAGEGECTQLNVIYHILAPWWPMWKKLANPHIALILKSTYIFIPSSHDLGGKKPTRHSCMVPVGTAVKNCTFSMGHGLKRSISAVAGSNIPQGGGEEECSLVPKHSPTFYHAAPRDQHLLMFLEKSMVCWIANELKTRASSSWQRKRNILLNCQFGAAAHKSACTGLTFCYQRDMVLTLVRSSAVQSWPRSE